VSCETGYEKPHPEAYRRVPRTLGDEVEAVRRVIRTGREELRVPELCFSHGDQENPPEVSQPIPGRCLHVEAKRNPGGDMANNARVPKAEITGIYGGLLKVAMRKMLGEVPDSAEVMWQNPRVLKDMMGFGRKTEKWDRMDPNLASFASMAAASQIGCSFCLDFGYFMTHNKGLDEAKAREVPRWRESDVFTPLERRVMEYAEAMSQTPPTVTDEMSAALLEELGAPALLELTARIGGMNLTARTNIALGIQSQEFSAACGLQPLATPSADVVSSA
jgi:alkylhydroperoxidase family enzyme